MALNVQYRLPQRKAGITQVEVELEVNIKVERKYEIKKKLFWQLLLIFQKAEHFNDILFLINSENDSISFENEVSDITVIEIDGLSVFKRFWQYFAYGPD
jgi:hypothetical protein